MKSTLPSLLTVRAWRPVPLRVCPAWRPVSLPLFLSLLVAGSLFNSRAVAQVIPDGTLGPESSQVLPNGVTVEDAAADLIRAGARRGENLFHSFEQFSVGDGQRVYFENPAGVARVFSRVTGELGSDILGTLGSLGGADLFLLNPNGIVFGPNARLDVGGSFVASTADAFEFAEVGSFSARAPEVPTPLLTIQPSALTFGQVPPGDIRVRSQADEVGLSVPNGESLVLLGGDVTVNGGLLSALGGRIEVGAAAGEGAVGLEPDGRLTFDDALARGGVRFRNGAIANVRLAGTGSIAITALSIDSEQSQLLAGIRAGLDSSGRQANDIVLNATNNIRLSSSAINNGIEPEANGIGGSIIITSSTLEVLEGSELSVVTLGRGDAGNIIVDSQLFKLIGDNSILVSVTGGAGSAGNIVIDVQRLEILEGAQLVSGTLGASDAGDVEITASESVRIAGRSRNEIQFVDGSTGFATSGIFSPTLPGSRGSGGTINITTQLLEVFDGAQLSSSTSGEGDAGNIVIDAESFRFIGDSPGNSLISSGTTGAGNAGNIVISVHRLEAREGAQLIARTIGGGNAGNVTIMASESVRFVGQTKDEVRFASGDTGFALTSIISRTDVGSTGNGGTIAIATPLLEVLEGAQLSSSTRGQGNAGNIVINAGSRVRYNDGTTFAASDSTTGRGGNITINVPILTLANQSEILTQTKETDGGNITLNLDNLLALTGNSTISTEAGTAQAGGNGGDITISAPFLVSAFSEDSDIVADAFDGSGGNVSITASGGIFGIAPQDFRTPESDITASSENGVSGTISLETPDVDPSQSTAELPSAFTATDVVQSCRERFAATGSSFVVMGRGGIPQGPQDPQPTILWQDALPIEREAVEVGEPASQESRIAPQPIVEAQGWVKNDQGQVVLVAGTSANVGQPLACEG